MELPRDIPETAREASAPASTDFLPLDDSNDSDLHGSSDGEAGGGHEDSASDVSMAAESDEDGYDPAALQPEKPTATTGPAQGNAPPSGDTSRKRKSPGDGPDSHAPDPTLSAGSAKKVKLDGVDKEDDSSASIVPGNKSLLPAGIWHHIFSFCPPRTLGSLLLVSRLFNVYLDPSSTIHREHPALLSQSVLPVVQPNTIWKRSRRLFWPGMPSPLRDKTELDMWRLSCPTSCQHCGKVAAQGPASPTDPSHPGPGLDGVALVWPFATRSCGPCLLKKSTKEIDILLSPSTPSALVPSLPFVLVSQELHAYSVALIERGQLPANTQMTKLFWAADVESMEQEFDDVKKLGKAAAEEWLKGLEGRGKARQTDSAKWENWAGTGGVAQMKTTLHPGYQKVEVIAAQAPAPQPKFQIPGLGSLATSPDTSHDTARLSNSAPGSTSRAESVSSNGISTLPSKSFSHGRQERTKEEVAELKAARKAEIERRCLLLDPPLPANVLAHIPSFQAAIQIIAPLDDKAWDLLLPRLLAQRAEAEEREKQITGQDRISQELAERQKMDGPRLSKDAPEADWDEVQAPVRARIARLADEIIQKNWDDGDKVAKENSPKFAAEVLIYVRKRFYAEIAQEADKIRAAGKEPPVDPVGGPFTQKLTLENMKWIFDTKIKPHTEPYRKELFICNGCESNSRYYGFEGVIQHYAAKHTSILSSGNIVVHWRAEWPEHPPFNPEGRPGRSQYHGQGPSRSYVPNPAPAPPRYSYNAYQAPPPAGAPPGPYSPYTAGPSYSGTGYGEQYAQPAQPPYPPQGGYGPPGYGPPPYGSDPYAPPPYPNAPPPATPYHNSSQPPPQAFAAPSSAPPVPTSAPAPAASQYSYNYGAYQANSQAGYPAPQAASHTEQFRRQLEDMARSARELWNATSNMKDVPGSVRVFVVIHHISKGFNAKFGETPSLSMFIEGLSNNKDMRPVRNVNGLMCKVCHLHLDGYIATEQEKKSFSLPQLANHFQSKHVEPFMQMGQYATPPDWVTDMVLLPDPSVLSRLRTAVGMDSQKQFLVSDALPQVLGNAVPAPGPAHPQPSWQAGESYHSGYQGPSDHGQYYAPPHESDPPPANQTAAPHPGVAASYGQYPNQPYNADASFQPWYGGVAPSQTEPAPPSAAPTAARPQPEPSGKIRNAPYGKQGGNGRKSSQGFRQSREQQRQNKKNKKAGGGGGGSASANAQAETAKLTEEEAKLAEEEERRREEEIRAMWAADRAETARKSTRPEDRQAKGPGKPPATGPSSAHTSKTHTPLQHQRAPSVPRPSIARAKEEPSLIDALEMHLSKPPSPPYQERAYRPPPPTNAIYIDDRQQIAPLAARRTPERFTRYDDPRPEVPRARSRSPVYYDYGRPAPAQAYRERSPPPPLPRHAEPPYQGMPEPVPLDAVRYERPPPPREEYYPRGYADEPPRGPPRVTEYVELVEVRDSQGTYYIERPVRRQPEPERYYAAYEGERPIRRELEPYPPYQRAYSRAPPPPPPPAPAYGPRPPPPGPVYEALPPRTPAPREGPPPPAPISRDDPAYYEEYDPHFPAAPPSNPPRPVRYQ